VHLSVYDKQPSGSDIALGLLQAIPQNNVSPRVFNTDCGSGSDSGSAYMSHNVTELRAAKGIMHSYREPTHDNFHNQVVERLKRKF